MSGAHLDKRRREEEQRADELELARVLREPAEEPRPPTQPLSVQDGDLLLIGKQGAIDVKGYAELAERFDHPIASDEYDPEDARLYGDLRREGWPAA